MLMDPTKKSLLIAEAIVSNALIASKFVVFLQLRARSSTEQANAIVESDDHDGLSIVRAPANK